MYNKRKFRRVRFILLRISWLFKFIAQFRKPEKRLLLVKLDAIGDYILFRNFIEVLKTSAKYKDYEIELLGNKVWKDLALEYDRTFISKFHFIDEEPLYVRPSTVLRLGYMLFKRRYELVMHPTYSRSLMGTGLAALAAGRENIAYNYTCDSDLKYKKQTDKLHTRMLELPEDVYHEYERDRYFFEQVTDQRNLPYTLSLPVVKTKGNTIIVFPGSSYYKRNWEKENFLEIIKRLLSETSKDIIIAGGPSEVPVASYLIGHLQPCERLTDLTGQSTLPQLVQLIANSQLVISNETSAVHIAAACKTPVICIQGGGHYERFTPYTNRITQFKPICIYEPMPCYNCNWNCKYYNDFNEPFPCISRINIEKVWLEIFRLI